MLAELGHLTLILAFVFAVLQFVLPLWGAARDNVRLQLFADNAAYVQCALLVVSYLALTAGFMASDFSILLVAEHSHTDKPWIYRISGVWANHEGSILLWVLILAIYGALAALFGQSLPLSLRARALAVQGALGAGFLAFVIFTSNPFERLNPVPMDGMGLNPLLQDPGLAVHPPFLYLGYVGFSMSFSFALAALLEGRVDAIWARWLRPWVLLAWSFLTIGIAIGSFWAYYELGWGGWWMWDPVENVSFMPWLLGTALLHSIMVLGTRHTMASWTILLAIATFSFSLIGTFIVRSGVLVSIHAFAVDPARGSVILWLLGVSTGAALILYAIRAHKLLGGPFLPAMSRGGALILNNILLVAATFFIVLGTFYPLLVELQSNEKISVGRPFFDATYVPIMFLLLGFMAVGPLLKWRKTALTKVQWAWVAGLGPALAVLFVISFLTDIDISKTVIGPLGIVLAAGLAYGTFAALWTKSMKGKTLGKLPASVWGFAWAHMGMAVATFGITVMSVWAEQNYQVLKPGESITTAGYVYRLDDLRTGQQDNYGYLEADIIVSKNGREITTLQPQRRYFPVRDMITTEAGFQLGVSRALFAAIGEGDAEKGWIVRTYYHPWVLFIWIGALMMALAGFISLFDRRLRFAGSEGRHVEP